MNTHCLNGINTFKSRLTYITSDVLGLVRTAQRTHCSSIKKDSVNVV